MSRKQDTKQQKRRGEHGSALLLAVFVLVLLATMGIALLFLAQSEVNTSQAVLRGQKVFYHAEAGLEDGRTTLAATGSGDLSTDLAAYANDGVFDFDPDSIRPVYGSGGSITGFTGYGDDIPLRELTNFGDGWYAAFLTNDPADGISTVVDTNDRVMITAVGGGPNKSLETVQLIIEPKYILPTIPPATITLLGPSPDFYGGDTSTCSSSGGSGGSSGSGSSSGGSGSSSGGSGGSSGSGGS